MSFPRIWLEIPCWDMLSLKEIWILTQWLWLLPALLTPPLTLNLSTQLGFSFKRSHINFDYASSWSLAFWPALLLALSWSACRPSPSPCSLVQSAGHAHSGFFRKPLPVLSFIFIVNLLLDHTLGRSCPHLICHSSGTEITVVTYANPLPRDLASRAKLLF